MFFSIASSIADFGDLKALGRIVGKVVGCYLITSVIAISVGYLVYQVFPIGDAALKEAVTDAASSTIAKGEGMTISIKDTIVSIIPSDYISPFLNSNMLQLIFMAGNWRFKTVRQRKWISKCDCKCECRIFKNHGNDYLCYAGRCILFDGKNGNQHGHKQSAQSGSMASGKLCGLSADDRGISAAASCDRKDESTQVRPGILSGDADGIYIRFE